jgi:glycosyltransferase involved in cell wall biosynthesis
MAISYSIILPAFNESERLGASLEKVLAYVAEQGWDAEVIVVNDGSRDNTAEIAGQFAARNPAVRVLENPGNRGKGYSVRHGVLESRGDYILFSDSDLSSPIREASKLFAKLREGADVAFGSRWLETNLQTERQSILRQIVGRLYNILLRVTLGLNYKDTQCGLKAFTREAAEVVFTRQTIERWGFDPELLFIARKFKLRMVEVPVEWAHDDRSKINPLVDGVKMGIEMLRIRWAGITGVYKSPKWEFAHPRTAASTANNR